MTDCLFCKIINGDISATLAYEDEKVVAFNDIKPQAPTHLLIVPRTHIVSLNELDENNQAIIGHMAQVAATLAKNAKHAEDGYRLVMNCNEHGGQSVFHIHMHLLAGRQMHWPPG